jgi:hypothetical protein
MTKLRVLAISILGSNLTFYPVTAMDELTCPTPSFISNSTKTPHWNDPKGEHSFYRDVKLQQIPHSDIPNYTQPHIDLEALNKYHYRQRDSFEKLIEQGAGKFYNFDLRADTLINDLTQELDQASQKLHEKLIAYMAYGSTSNKEAEVAKDFYLARESFNQVCNNVAEKIKQFQETIEQEDNLKEVSKIIYDAENGSQAWEGSKKITYRFSEEDVFNYLKQNNIYISTQALEQAKAKHAEDIFAWANVLLRYNLTRGGVLAMTAQQAGAPRPSMAAYIPQLIGQTSSTIKQAICK